MIRFAPSRALARTLLCTIAFVQPAHPAGAAEVPTKGMLLWLHADRPAELDRSGGMATWENRAPGAAKHATQELPASRPRWVKTVPSLGGRPALQFDGNDDFLRLPWLRLGARTTVVFVAENTRQTPGGSYWRTVLGGDDDSFRDGATKYSFGFRRDGLKPLFIANLYYAPGKSHRLMEPVEPSQQSTFHVYGFCRDGQATAGTALRVDGVAAARLTADKDPPGFPGVGYTLGQGADAAAGKPSRFYRGRIAEVLVYDRPLAPAEMLGVEAYLAKKYGLPRGDAPPTRGLALWLSADSLAALAPNEPAWQWPDQCARRHAAQNDPARRPVVRARAVNGQPALDFRGAKHFDLRGWRPGPGSTVYAAVRSAADRPAEVVRTLPAIDPRWVQGGAPFEGLLSELLVYDGELSADERKDLEHYLACRYSESDDPRRFERGTLIHRNGYNDQPYVVHCRDGSWLCVITTSAVAEHGDDRTLVVTRSRDQGRTWSPARTAIEPVEMRQPSWATLYVTPYGRVYALYNLREHPLPQRSSVGFFFKYSDDHGETWSENRYEIPIRKIALDREAGSTGGWSVCPPVALGSDVLVSYARTAPPGRRLGQGFVFRSDNLQRERDPAKIRWEMLPAGDHGIRADDVPSSMQEEHIITPLSQRELLCIWRTTAGYACHSYSRDGGRTWGERGFATYEPGGRRIKQPLACCRPFRTADGRYLLWFHNTQPLGQTALYRPRNVAWIAGGQLRDGRILWSQPEVLLYGFDLPVGDLGLSYPDFVEQDGRLWVTTTDKQDARIFPLDPALLEGLFQQTTRRDAPTDGLVLDLRGPAFAPARSISVPRLPSLLDGGFTVHLTLRADELPPGRPLVKLQSGPGKGWTVTAADRGRLRIELADGRHASEPWTTDPGVIEPGRTHQVTFIVDGGPDLILTLVDGLLGDGADDAPRGWGRFSRQLTDVSGDADTLSVAGSVQRLRLYARPLRVSEAVRLHRSNDR